MSEENKQNLNKVPYISPKEKAATENYYQYLFTVKNDSLRKLDTISSIMAIMAIVAILYVILVGPFPKTPQHFLPKWFLAFPLAALVGLGYNWYQMHKFNKKTVWFRPVLLFLSIPCILYIHWLVGMVLIVLGMLERYAKKPLEIGISERHIAINTLPKKSYGWFEIDHVILRDDILTIDFNNNRFLQKQVNTSGNDIDLDKDVVTFNDFCQNLIESARKSNKL